MHRIVNHLDNYAEVWGAFAFGILAVASCAAIAFALGGILR
jgi:hypothetical protein